MEEERYIRGRYLPLIHSICVPFDAGHRSGRHRIAWAPCLRLGTLRFAFRAAPAMDGTANLVDAATGTNGKNLRLTRYK